MKKPTLNTLLCSLRRERATCRYQLIPKSNLQPTKTLQLQVKEQENKGEEPAKFYVEAEASASDLTFVDQAKWYGVRCDLSYAYNYEFDLNRNR